MALGNLLRVGESGRTISKGAFQPQMFCGPVSQDHCDVA